MKNKLTASQQAWVDALRSGKYKQATYRLKDRLTNGFCCLGVLCEVSNQGFFDDNDSYVCDETLADATQYSTQIVPKKVQDWIGLRSNMGAMGTTDSLTGLNDAEGLTFSQIADVIERRVEELFVSSEESPKV
jgi:hypothetical protein